MYATVNPETSSGSREIVAAMSSNPQPENRAPAYDLLEELLEFVTHLNLLVSFPVSLDIKTIKQKTLKPYVPPKVAHKP